jgi:hypothetical protein
MASLGCVRDVSPPFSNTEHELNGFFMWCFTNSYVFLTLAIETGSTVSFQLFTFNEVFIRKNADDGSVELRWNFD